MWIRSQKRNTLCVVDNFTLRKIPQGYEVHSPTGVLGYYSSKEKALKVLDNIEEFIKCSDYFTAGNGYPVVRTKIFQMPQDDEVTIR